MVNKAPKSLKQCVKEIKLLPEDHAWVHQNGQVFCGVVTQITIGGNSIVYKVKFPHNGVVDTYQVFQTQAAAEKAAKEAL